MEGEKIMKNLPLNTTSVQKLVDSLLEVIEEVGNMPILMESNVVIDKYISILHCSVVSIIDEEGKKEMDICVLKDNHN